MAKIGLIYVRQSRHRDYERTTSPDVQEAACRDLTAVQTCDQVEVFIDLDKSGKCWPRHSLTGPHLELRAGMAVNPH